MTRTEAYNKLIEDYKNTPPNYDELAVLWLKVTQDRMKIFYKTNYSAASLTDEQVDVLARVDAVNFQKSLSADDFRKQLDELHTDSVAAAIKQLEFERDNPDKSDSPNPEPKESQIEKDGRDPGGYIAAIAAWMITRIVDNYAGMAHERGDIAKAVRVLIGVSVEDIKKYGILGGDNSYLRKVMPQWDHGQPLLGGENSFFRKNLGLPW